MSQKIRLVATRNDVSYRLDLQDAPNVSLNFKFSDITDLSKKNLVIRKPLCFRLRTTIIIISKIGITFRNLQFRTGLQTSKIIPLRYMLTILSNLRGF